MISAVLNPTTMLYKQVLITVIVFLYDLYQ